MTITIAAIAVPIVAALIITDVRRWITWIAERIVSRAARRFDARNRPTKDEEYRANVQHAEGPLSMLMYAIFTYIKAPYRARELREHTPRPEAPTVEVGSQQRLLDPLKWQVDIDRSVAEYDQWYLAESPRAFARAREHVVADVTKAMQVTDDFRALDADSLMAWPGALFIARTCVSPQMSRDRFIGLCGANRSLVVAMERNAIIPDVTHSLRKQVQMMCDFLRPLFDPGASLAQA